MPKKKTERRSLSAEKLIIPAGKEVELFYLGGKGVSGEVGDYTVYLFHPANNGIVDTSKLFYLTGKTLESQLPLTTPGHIVFIELEEMRMHPKWKKEYGIYHVFEGELLDNINSQFMLPAISLPALPKRTEDIG